MSDFLTLAMPVIKSIAFALVVLIVGLLIIKWITKIVGKAIDKGRLEPTLKPFLKSLASVGLKVLLIVAIIDILGIETTSLVTLLGTAAVSIGLAFQGSLANFAGGLLLLISRPFKVGDYIESNGYGGTVEAVRILYTDIVTIDNTVVRIPNGILSNASLINYSLKDKRRVDLKFTAAYEADSAKVISVLNDIIADHLLTLKEPEPFVKMSEYGENGIVYTVRVWVNTPDYWTVHFDIIEKAKQRFDKEGISIPYPQIDVNLKNRI